MKAKLLLIGDGALRREIENEVDQRGLHDSVIFTGNVGNVNEYLMAMDALVFPSFFEGLPLTLLEAQASGLYSVVSDRITSQVFLNECMVSMPLEANAGEWAEKLLSIPTINREEMNCAVSKSAFNMQQSIAQLMLLYEKMLKQKFC